MAEYIEREALIAEIQKNINTYWNEGSGGYYLAEDAINYSVKTAPTADVVPKSEVERLQGRIAELQIDLHYSVCREDEARQKVAREIFEEMDGITELFIKGLIGELEMYDQLAELKKKYTEGNDE